MNNGKEEAQMIGKVKHQWNGTYKGISWEMQRYDIGGKIPNWTYYLYIQLDRLPAKIRDRFWLKPQRHKRPSGIRVSYHYNEEPLIENLPWHGGCTWYSKERGFDGEPRGVKIGCDYAHLHDHAASETEDTIFQDVKKTIDALWEAIPKMKIRCSYCGQWKSSTDDKSKCFRCLKKEQMEDG